VADKPTIFTIGHSTLSIADFIAELKTNGVKYLVDVRKLTGSNAFPQFDEDRLARSLAAAGIAYKSIHALSGRRPRDYAIDLATTAVWLNQSFHNYADYATTQPFSRGLDQLERLAAHHVVAIMCAEAVWWRCHRRIIADHLLAQGYPVQHIMDGGKTETATITPGGKVADGSVTYPAKAGAPKQAATIGVKNA
jgi:uncharacterized protein (DUF488 family)